MSVLLSIDKGSGWGSLRPNTEFGTDWPDGAIARQVAFSVGPRQCDIQYSAIFLTFNYDEEGNSTGKIFYLSLDGSVSNGFDIPYSEPSGYGSIIEKHGNVHYATFQNLDTSWKDLYRSTDKGVTWTLSKENVSDFSRICLSTGFGNVHWMVTQIGGYDLWRSDDEGETWTHVYQFTEGEDLFSWDEVTIAASPVEADVLVAYCQIGTGFDAFSAALVSTNGGVSFSTIQLKDDEDDITLGIYKNIAIAESGRCCIAVETHEGGSFGDLVTHIFYADSPYTSWTEVSDLPDDDPETDNVCDPGFGPMQTFDNNSFMFGANTCLSNGQIVIWRSDDGGETWQSYVIGLSDQTEGGIYHHFPSANVTYISNNFWPVNPGVILYLKNGGVISEIMEGFQEVANPDFVAAFGNAITEY